ncbi:Protein phosphatase PP2A regulatory subunit B [Mortierella polycephala]|uniref:Protein phosphatase PP2A regulatory subunit B n=1 Tax=Mortierella polycephala TaxID=41804 RepID=A0A9P6PUL4_9FUNG|nr:Protein phosphatase PP2A regulatory subunit B [Mortierella polycephala]
MPPSHPQDFVTQAPIPQVPPYFVPAPEATPIAGESLYVGELDPSVNEIMLLDIFSLIGPVVSIRVCREAVSRRSLGYAYVNLLNYKDGEHALEALNDTLIKGRPCRLMWSNRNPALRKKGTGNVFIKNLDPMVDSKSLHETFSACGNILSCKVATDKYGNSKGYAFIHYETYATAEGAIKHVDGMLLNDRKVFASHHISKAERMATAKEMNAKFTNVYIRNLDSEATQEEVVAMLTKFGPVNSSVISTDENGRCKGFGLFNFERYEDARRAVEELHESEFRGRVLYVCRAQKRSDHEEEIKKSTKQRKIEEHRKCEDVNLFIKNLDSDIDDDVLHQEFAVYGPVTSAKVMRHKKPAADWEEQAMGPSKGFGFVCFSSPDDASKAIVEMNGRKLGSKPIYAALAQLKEVRKARLEAQWSKRIQARMQPHPTYQMGPGRMCDPESTYPVADNPLDTNMIHPMQSDMMPPPYWSIHPSIPIAEYPISSHDFGNLMTGLQGRPQKHPPPYPNHGTDRRSHMRCTGIGRSNNPALPTGSAVTPEDLDESKLAAADPDRNR